MAVTLPAGVLDRYERFTLYNSPYPAHDRGCAVDLYPPGAVEAHPGGGRPAPSPVAGTVRAVRTVDAPSRSYAAAEDHLVLVDVERPADAAGLVARLLHVDPAVEPGDHVAMGDDIGELVRSGYYAPWVPDHVHLGFRPPDADLHRASGSLALALGVDVEPLPWDGTGTVVETGDTYAVLDRPAHPAPGERWVGVAATLESGGATGALDGGLTHYEGGGLLGTGTNDGAFVGPVALAGRRVGVADGRDVAWDDLTVLANGRPVRGLSLFCARDAGFGAKLVGESLALEAGEDVAVTVSAGTDD